MSDIQLLRDLADTLEQERAEVQSFIKSVEETNRHLDNANARIAKLQAVADAAKHLLAGGDKEAVYHLEQALADLENNNE